MTRKRLTWVHLALILWGALAALLGLRLGWAQEVKVGEIGAVKAPASSSWVAACGTITVTATSDVTLAKATAKAGRVAVLVAVQKAPAWMSCHRLGEYDKAPVWACRGPDKLREQMASSCALVASWADLGKLKDAKLRDWIIARSTCCGESSLGYEWPCAWKGVQVTRLDGYGPGVVGSERACPAPVDRE